MPCGNGTHVFHHFSLQELIRRRKRESGRAVVLPCVYCRHDCDIGALASFFCGTNTRPVRSRVLDEDDHAETFWERNKSLEAHVRH